MKPCIYPSSRGSAWVKVLESVDPEAEDGYGYQGEFKVPGSLAKGLRVGTVLLERVSGRKGRVHHLYVLDGDGDWERVASSDLPAWAVVLREKARELLGQEPASDR